ncbi:hypothetical protein FP2506_05486 [Fulvimarina pelagi HTCC2506]|uniref:Uncharacterized protein n=1 Tax=Fulvimarina pelagi HTCC2506 TaxID=314231 RepID=Q0G7U9_9HYPH|nr:hypothetical protein [Fulvimarina pelagi]EAU42265.1 hypothetical protein FP2506_05486 [Fulvimarina pelagi HTCC2506]
MSSKTSPHDERIQNGQSRSEDGLLDKTARLAIEVGPGHGFQKVISDMTNVCPNSVEHSPSDTGEPREPEAAIEQVGVDDLAFAAKEMEIKRLVLVTPFADAASTETVLTLSRLLTEDNHPVALIQLDRTAASPIASPEEEAAGWIDLLGGGRPVGEIIHRDPKSRLHVAPSGNVDVAALEEEQFEDLAVYLAAFCRSYSMTVVHLPADSLGRIEGLGDVETAVIVVASEDRADDVERMARELNPAGSYDVLHLISENETPILH